MPRVKSTAQKKTTRRSSRFVCPECGFKAAHAMGLGRHRSAKHGVLSQRQKREARAAGGRGRRASGNQRDLARLEKRLADLERKHNALLRSLRQAVGSAFKAR